MPFSCFSLQFSLLFLTSFLMGVEEKSWDDDRFCRFSLDSVCTYIQTGRIHTADRTRNLVGRESVARVRIPSPPPKITIPQPGYGYFSWGAGFEAENANESFLLCQKSSRRGDHRSPADFAKAKSVAARRKSCYFPSENPKNFVFRRAINDRPYNLRRKKFCA